MPYSFWSRSLLFCSVQRGRDKVFPIRSVNYEAFLGGLKNVLSHSNSSLVQTRIPTVDRRFIFRLLFRGSPAVDFFQKLLARWN